MGSAREEGEGGNAASMESPENDGAVSRPSHSRLRNADETGVSHISTLTGGCGDSISESNHK